MEILTAQSNLNQARFAVQEVVLALADFQPDFVVMAASPAAHFEACQSLLHQHYPEVQLIGCSSFDGIMTEQGFCQSETGASLGIWALSDPEGTYGAGISSCEHISQGSVSDALEQALANANRDGELPSLVWLLSASGQEELVLEQLATLMGCSVPVIGGGAASCMVEDGSSLIAANESRSASGVVLAVLFPSGALGYSFHAGCTMVKPLGIATKVEGNTLIEIDNQPALTIYEDALGRSLQPLIDNEQWVDIPIGRVQGEHYNLPMYTLALPYAVDQNAIELYAPVQEGETLYLMKGSEQVLKERSQRVLTSAMEMLPEGRLGLKPKGALLAYCACCMQLLANELADEKQSIGQVLGEDVPFLTLFTQGEVGPLIHAQNIYGNMMIAAVAFYAKGESL